MIESVFESVHKVYTKYVGEGGRGWVGGGWRVLQILQKVSG